MVAQSVKAYAQFPTQGNEARKVSWEGFIPVLRVSCFRAVSGAQGPAGHNLLHREFCFVFCPTRHEFLPTFLTKRLKKKLKERMEPKRKIRSLANIDCDSPSQAVDIFFQSII